VRSNRPISAPRFPPFYVHDPLPADANLLRQRLLVEAKSCAVVADERPEISRRSNAHVFPPAECQRMTTLYQSQRSAQPKKSAIGDIPECQRTATYR